MIPKRIQRKRVKGWKMPPNTVYVGRPSRFGNPFFVGGEFVTYDDQLVSPTTVERCLYYFLRELEYTIKFEWEHHHYDFLAPIRGKNLACWCKIGAPCHGDVLLEMANR